MTQSTAGMMASMFGLMNLFARALGGWTSDRLNEHLGMRGRIISLLMFMILQGMFLIVFSRMKTLVAAGIMLLFFSICVQASEGATFAIVPYICPERTGSVAGLVGAGGNAGGMIWVYMFKSESTYQDVLMTIGFIVGSCSDRKSVV